jgi:CheY-like chemotaxis protein
MKVFYADDDQEEIGFFCEAIMAIDNTIECVTARDGEEALRLLQNITSLDFIFLDLQMPKINGRECLVQIKKDPSLKHIPVIIYSSIAAEKDILRLYAAGACKFLSKNCDIILLDSELRSILFKDKIQGPVLA